MAKLPGAALVLLGVACTAAPDRVPVDEAVRAVMAAQQVAWNNGDIPGFMEGYADTVCFISVSGTTCGREEVTRHYLSRYPDRAAMGRLHFGIGEVLPAGDAHAWSTGQWTLYREADTLGGGFTLLWVRQAEGWRIVRDHTY
jgi:ketosteroid isomerase-like protein